MNKKFTKLIAALALLVFMTPSLAGWGQTRSTETFSYSDYKGQGTQSSGSSYTMVKTDVSITNTKFYGNTSYAHFYASGTTTITPKTGVTITQIVLTASSTSYNGYQNSGTITASTGSVSGNSNSTTVTWTGSASSDFTISNNKQIRWTSIVVTYTTSGGTTPTPSMSVSTNSIDFGSNTINPSEPYTQTFNVTFANLKQDLTVTGFTGVTVSPATIAHNDQSPKTVTVSYNPTTEGSIDGDITVSSDNSEVSAATVAVTGSAYDPENVDTYKKHTGTLVEGDYVIINSTNAMKNTLYNSRFTNESVTITNNTITNPATSIIWHIAPIENTNYWTIYNDAVEKYAGGTSNKNQGALLNEVTTHAQWIITIGSGGICTIENYGRSQDSSDPDNKYLRNNGSNGWATYASNTGGAPQLYKKVIANQVAAPVITVPATFVGSTTATITCEATGATIYYSYDNSTWTEYTTALTIIQTTTIYAKAVNGSNESAVVSKTTTKVLPTPTVTIDPTGITNTDVYEETEAGTLVASVTYENNPVQGATVTWSGDNDAVATINASTGAVTLVAAGTVNFTATFAGNAEYSSASATYAMTVTSSAPYEQPTTVEVDLNNTFFGCNAFTSWSNGMETIYTGTQDNVNITLDKDSGSYMYINTNGIRLYQGNTLTFAAPSGYNITEIVLTGASGFSTDLSATVGDLDNGTWTGSASSVEITGKTGGHNMTKATITLALPAVAYSITYSDNLTNGAFAATGNPTSAYEGDNVTVTTTPDTGYHLASMTYNYGETSGNATISGNTGSFTMPGDDVLVSAVFAQDVTYTITYSENGQTILDGVIGGTIGNSLITTSFNDAPANLTFVGWCTDAIGTYQTTCPTLVDGNYNVTDNVTFYAVYKYDYSYTTGGGTPTWTKVTDASSLRVGDQLVIASDDAATLKAAGEVSGGYMAAEDANSESVFTIPNSAVVLTLGGEAGAWTLSNNNRLLGSASGSVRWNEGVTTWNISISDGNATIGLSSNTEMRFLYNVQSPRFKTYSSSANASMILPQLYRLEGGSTTVSGTYYLTSVTEITASTSITGNQTLSNNVTLGDGSYTINGKLDANGYLIINEQPDRLVVNNGGQLIHGTSGVRATVKKHIDARSSDPANGGWNFIATPMTSTSVANTAETNIASIDFDLYRFNQAAENEWQNYKTAGSNEQHVHFQSLTNGTGYLYSNNTDIDVLFMGTLVNNSSSISLVYTNDNPDQNMRGWNLVGNPFPCNAIVDKPFYVVSGRSVTSGSSTIAPCEGIMVKTDEPGQTITFTKVTPEQGASQPQQLQITLTQEVTTRGNAKASYEDNAIVSFNEGSQLEKFYFGEGNANIYIPQNGKEYAIAVSEAQGEMPVNFKAAEDGSYTLTVSPENVEMHYLHLIDNLTGANIDLLQTPSYTFNATMMDYASRFRLVFCTGSAFEDENGDNVTFAYYNGSEWVLASEGEATLQVVDMMGRVLSSETVNGNASVKVNAPAGVYVLRLVNGEKVMTQKIVVR